jgi:MurNAc alpha-1-phosphate uridylyltransferase
VKIGIPVLILAGGLAKRIHSITKKTPKAMIQICGKPFIDWQLKYLANNGIKKVVLCLGHMGEDIEKYVKSGDRYNLEIQYSYDGSKLLGTGGAIKKALPLLDKYFFVLYGDTFLPIDYSEVYNAFLENKKKPIMTIYKNNNNLDISNVIYENNALIEYNKFLKKPNMKYIDYGLSILNTGIFNNYKKGINFDLSEVMYDLSIKNKLIGYPIDKRFYEIGSYDGIRDTESFLVNF